MSCRVGCVGPRRVRRRARDCRTRDQPSATRSADTVQPCGHAARAGSLPRRPPPQHPEARPGDAHRDVARVIRANHLRAGILELSQRACRRVAEIVARTDTDHGEPRCPHRKRTGIDALSASVMRDLEQVAAPARASCLNELTLCRGLRVACQDRTEARRMARAHDEARVIAPQRLVDLRRGPQHLEGPLAHPQDPALVERRRRRA